MKKDSTAVFVIGAALTGAVVAAFLSVFGFEGAAVAGATGFGVALWFIAWISVRSRGKPPGQPTPG